MRTNFKLQYLEYIPDAFWDRFYPYKNTPFELWLAPNIGSDLQRLFTEPETWATVRASLEAFQLYGQHLTITDETHPAYAGSRVGPNTTQNLIAAGVFDRLREWQMPIALEVGGYTRHDCSGQQGRQQFAQYLEVLHGVGHTLGYASIMEPTVEASACGMDDTTAIDRLAALIAEGSQYATIGVVESYGFSSAQKLNTWLRELNARGGKPAHFHIALDRWAVYPTLFADLKAMQKTCAELGIVFGFVATVSHAHQEPDYAEGVRDMVRIVRAALGRNPDRFIVQSWWPRDDKADADLTGIKDLPYCAPETDSNSLTGLANGL